MATGSTYAVDLLTQDGSSIVRAGELQFQSATNQPATAPNALYIRQFPFTYQTSGLTTGVALYTPAVGDVIYDMGVSVTTAFNGTTPLADLGTFSSTVGVFKELASAAIDLTDARADITDNTGLASESGYSWLLAALIVANTAAESGFLPQQLVVTAAAPILLVVSQDGSKGGTAIGGTAGVGTVYIVTGTPA